MKSFFLLNGLMFLLIGISNVSAVSFFICEFNDETWNPIQVSSNTEGSVMCEIEPSCTSNGIITCGDNQADCSSNANQWCYPSYISGTPGVGICQGGWYDCFGECTNFQGPVEEWCNGVDDDCDIRGAVVFHASSKEFEKLASAQSSDIVTALTAVNAEIDECLTIADNIHTEIALINAQSDSALTEIALANTEIDKMAAEVTLSNAEVDKSTAEVALSNTEVDKMAAEVSLANAEIDKAVTEIGLAL